MPTLRESYEAKGAIITPAGIWKRDEETGKKIPIVAFRTDGLDFANFPKDNIAKFRIEEVVAPEGMRLLIVDADSQHGKDRAEKLFPQCLDTFSYQTSQSYKRHYWFFVPMNSFEEFRAINALEDIDMLTYGVAFTAHFFREAEYQLPDFSKEILHLDEKSRTVILASLDDKNTSYGGGNHTAFVNKEMARLVTEYSNGKLDITTKSTEASTNRNMLFKQLTPKADKAKGQRKFDVPSLSHTSLNTIALLVAKNSKIPNDVAVKFCEKLLTDIWQVSLNSELTQVHWYNSILPTVPFFEALFNPLEDFRDFDQMVEDITTDNTKDKNYKWALFMTAINGSTKFIQLNKDTYKLRYINREFAFDENYIRRWYPNLAKDDLDDIPHLALMTNPYEDLVIYDEDNDIYLLNTFHPSRYKINSVEKNLKPDNIVMTMIEKFFSNPKHEELYFHWLAHLLYGDKAMNMVLWLCSDVNAEAGTGKTILSSALPAQLIGFDQATTVDSSIAEAGWGQIYDTKLLSYNDLNKMKENDWMKLYAKIKDEASNSTSKIRNSKGGGVFKSTVGICQSGSSNFIPKVDSSDRRFFIISPREKLDKVGADELHRIFEADRDAEHTEIQDLADWLLHLYTNERELYNTELFTRAPMTAEKNSSSLQGAYSSTIIPRIMTNPRELFDIYKEETTVNHEWQDWQIIEFIKLQTSEDKVYLPHQFLNCIINRVKGTDEARGVASVMSTLSTKKTKIGVHHLQYKDIEKLKELGLPTEAQGWSIQGVVTDITESSYNNFMPKKLTAKGIHAIEANNE